MKYGYRDTNNHKYFIRNSGTVMDKSESLKSMHNFEITQVFNFGPKPVQDSGPVAMIFHNKFKAISHEIHMKRT